MKYTSGTLKFTWLFAVVLLVTPEITLAQDDDDERVPEEIIVTAQKREQRVQDIGINVTAISSEDLQTLELTNATGISQQVANFNTKYGVKGQNFVYTIRGIGLNDYNSNNNSTVGVYINEVNQVSPAMLNFPMYDMERVEILKGPQGTLYGRNATAGAVNFLTRRPTREKEGYVNLTIGDYDTANTEGAIGGPLSDTLSGRFSWATTYHGEDFVRIANENLNDLGSAEGFSVRGQIDWEPSDVFGLNLLVQREDSEHPVGAAEIYGISDGPFGALGGAFCSDALAGILSKDPSCVDIAGFRDPTDDRRVGFRSSDFIDHDNTIESTDITLRMNWDLQSSTLTSITGYKDWERSWIHDADSSPLVTADFFTDEFIEQFSQELRLSGSNDRVGWTVGGFYSEDTVDKKDLLLSDELLGAAFGVPVTNQAFLQDTQSLAIFAHVEWTLNDRLTMITGLRWSDEDRSLRGAVEPFIPEFNDSLKEDDVSGKIGLNYKPSDDLLVYGSISKGYKSGGFFADFGTDIGDFEPFTKEELYAYEIGTKYYSSDRSFRMTASAFYYDYKDKQANIQKGLAFGLSNIQQVDLYGLDVDVLWQPTDALDARLSLGLLSSEVKSDEIVGGFLGMPTLLTGTELADAPESTASGLLRYRWELAEGNSLYAQADASYTSEQFSQMGEDPLTFVPSYWLFNARLSWVSSSGNWELAGWIKNAFDKEFIINSFDAPILGHVEVEVGPPRTYGVSFRYTFY